MKKFFLSNLLCLFLLTCLNVYASIQSYDAYITATDIGKGGGDKTYTGSMKVKYWGSNNELGCQTYDAQWRPNAPSQKVAVIAKVEFRGFGYISGSISSSHGVTAISGISVGTFVKGPGGRAMQPSETDPKLVYSFFTDPTDAPWRNTDRAGTCTEYTDDSYNWSGTGAITIQGADWMSTSTTTTGSSNTQTEGTSSSQTEGSSNSIGSDIGTDSAALTTSHTQSESQTTGSQTSTSQTSSASSSEGGGWDSAGAPQPISVSDGSGNWIISTSTTSAYVCPQPYCFETVSTMNEHRRVCGDVTAATFPNVLKGCGQVYWVCPNSRSWYEVSERIDSYFDNLSVGDKVLTHETFVTCPLYYLQWGVRKVYCGYYTLLCNWGQCPLLYGEQEGCTDCYDGTLHHHFSPITIM